MPKSVKQKLNTRSTTESEIVGASDYLPETVWLMKFLEAQGHKVHTSVLKQDNESAIKLEKNGKRSGSKRTRHMDIRYFWIKDRLDAEDIKVEYCATEAMVADYFTKPLQGSLFNKLRRVIMGYEPVSSLMKPPVVQQGLEERVEMSRLGDPGDTRPEQKDSRVTYAEMIKKGL